MTEEGRSYELPDGTIIQADHEARYNATEILFAPEQFGIKSKSIPQMVVESIMKCPKYMRDVIPLLTRRK